MQAYAGVVANLLGSAAAAHLKGRLADQLRAALTHGAVKVADVARDLLAGTPLPPTQP